MAYIRFLVSFLVILYGCKQDDVSPPAPLLQLTSIHVGTRALNPADPSANVDIPTDQPFILAFPVALDSTSVRRSLRIIRDGDTIPIKLSYQNELKTVSAKPHADLANFEVHSLLIKEGLKGLDGSVFPGASIRFTTVRGILRMVTFKIDNRDALPAAPLREVGLRPIIDITFSAPVATEAINGAVASLARPGGFVPIETTWSGGNTFLRITASSDLDGIARHQVILNSTIQGVNGEEFSSIPEIFYTIVDPEPKFPIISDDALLTLVQQQTFKYFWDFGHPASGMARERNTSGNTVTTGGSGFGIMAIIVGIERNFITRTDGVARLARIVSFLETADRFHGVWPHWVNGNTGDVIPFSQKDNGGDLVETSFLVQGLLTFRQYLQPADTAGNNLINRINSLWKGVEWDWYRKNNENVLYWHWSPNYQWEMNFAMYGYFEQQITYFLAAASPTHSVPKVVYTNGYGRNGSIVKNNTYFGYKLPLESPSPLFWIHYSYLGLDPHFSDDFASYWEQNVNATLINRAYCISNPRNFVGYSEQCWGLTSSDNPSGYGAHSPGNDLGVITPTAALSSFPYTPTESMQALKFFYYNLGDKLWGPYGFYDAFNITQGWYASSYLAIDQGPIIVMIENHRTGLLWDLFMSAPEVQTGRTVLGFH